MSSDGLQRRGSEFAAGSGQRRVSPPGGTPAARAGRASPPKVSRQLGAAALLLVPIAEIWVLVQVAGMIGWWTVLVLLIGVVLGIWLIRRSGLRAWRALTAPQQPPGSTSADATSGSLLDDVLNFLAGVGFLIPGLLSDVMALSLLVPGIRSVARRLLRGYLTRRFGRLRTECELLHARSRGAVIEGEIIDDPPPR